MIPAPTSRRALRALLTAAAEAQRQGDLAAVALLETDALLRFGTHITRLRRMAEATPPRRRRARMEPAHVGR